MSLVNPTLDVLIEVLGGDGGCADHFPDICCTHCRGFVHSIEQGFLAGGPEAWAAFRKALHAKKRKPSGWDAQVEADEAERAGWGMRSSDDLKRALENGEFNPVPVCDEESVAEAERFGTVNFVEGGELAHEADRHRLEIAEKEAAVKRARSILEALK